VGANDRDHWFTLSTWKDKYLNGYAGELLLQMDIEGSEYEVIFSTQPSLLDQFRIIVIEFHHLDRLFDSFGFRILSSCFHKLLEYFRVVHIHPNNDSEVVSRRGIDIPNTMEFTFLNKRRITRTVPHLVFPHPLDADNTANPTLILPRCWYQPDAG
jgi:hypothetical protein